MTPVRTTVIPPPSIIAPLPLVTSAPVVTATLPEVVMAGLTQSQESINVQSQTSVAIGGPIVSAATLQSTIGEIEKKLEEDQEPQTLQQQENMMIKGNNARHMVMQKLMRKTEV